MIYQGGESSEIAEGSFVAQCNYEKARKERGLSELFRVTLQVFVGF